MHLTSAAAAGGAPASGGLAGRARQKVRALLPGMAWHMPRWLHGKDKGAWPPVVLHPACSLLDVPACASMPAHACCVYLLADYMVGSTTFHWRVETPLR